MIRVYLDKQILSKLFKQEDDGTRLLYQNLIANKDKMIFMFSHAHLEDIAKSDPTIRAKELEFLEEIIGKNFVYFSNKKKEIYYTHYRPIEAFEVFEKNLKDFEKNDFLDILRQNEIVKFALEIRNDPKKYQVLRNEINDNFNKGRFKSKLGSTDFNENIKSELNKNFVDFIGDILSMDKRKETDKREMFINLYIHLDLLGISRDKKGVDFINMQTDAEHAFYAQCCDILVTEDKGMLGKAPSVYNLLKIETAVMAYSEFPNFVDSVSNYPEETVENLIRNLSLDLNQNPIIADHSAEDYIHRLILTSHPYFYYFTQIESFSKNDKFTLVLTKKLTCEINFILYSEIKSVTNLLVKLFGIDDFGQNNFDYPTDGKAVSELKWYGRRWTFGEFTFHLTMPKDSVEMVLMITSVPQ